MREQKELMIEILESVFLEQPMISCKGLVASVEDNSCLLFYFVELKK